MFNGELYANCAHKNNFDYQLHRQQSSKYKQVAAFKPNPRITIHPIVEYAFIHPKLTVCVYLKSSCSTTKSGITGIESTGISTRLLKRYFPPVGITW